MKPACPEALQDSDPVALPEKYLLAAILEIAIRELTANAPLRTKRLVIRWFLDKSGRAGSSKGFFFKECVEHLNLEGWRVRKIYDYIDKLFKLHDASKPDTVQNCTLPEGLWFDFSPSNPSAPRKKYARRRVPARDGYQCRKSTTRKKLETT